MYQYRTVRPSFSTFTNDDWANPTRRHTDVAPQGRQTALSHLRFVSPARSFCTNPPGPSNAWVRAAYDGLRPKTYPPQRYLERADLTKFFVFNASIFNHNISMRLGRHSHTCNAALAWNSSFPTSPLQRLSRPRRNPFWCHLDLDRREGHMVAWK